MNRSRILSVGVAACLAAIATWALAFHVPAAVSADLRVLLAFQHLLREGNVDVVHRAASLLDAPGFTILSLAVLAIALLRRALGDAVAAAVVVAGSELTAQALKQITAAPREPSILPDALWPSGHITAACAFSVAFVLVSPPARRHVVAAVAGVAAGLIALSVLGLVTHHPSDAVGALLVTAAWTAGVLAVRSRATGRAITGRAVLGCVAAGAVVTVVYIGAMAALGHLSLGVVRDILRDAPELPVLTVAIVAGCLLLPLSVASAISPMPRAETPAGR